MSLEQLAKSPRVKVARFFPSEHFAGLASAAYAEHSRRITEHLPDADVRHVGGTSVPGLLTSGDIDLHVRVEAVSFAAARDVLCDLYEPLHRDRWTESVYFFDPDSDPRVELSLTAIGNIDDLHNGEAWRRIAHDPDLIEQYNALKRALTRVARSTNTRRQSAGSSTGISTYLVHLPHWLQISAGTIVAVAWISMYVIAPATRRLPRDRNPESHS